MLVAAWGDHGTDVAYDSGWDLNIVRWGTGGIIPINIDENWQPRASCEDAANAANHATDVDGRRRTFRRTL